MPLLLALLQGRWLSAAELDRLRHTEAGIARVMLGVAVSARRDQEPSFLTDKPYLALRQAAFYIDS